MNNFKKNLILIFSSFLIIIFICEIILRFFNLGYNNAPVDHSRIYHHINPKSFKFTSYSPSLEWKSFQIFYDNNGYRVAEQITENKEFGAAHAMLSAVGINKDKLNKPIIGIASMGY